MSLNNKDPTKDAMPAFLCFGIVKRQVRWGKGNFKYPFYLFGGYLKNQKEYKIKIVDNEDVSSSLVIN